MESLLECESSCLNNKNLLQVYFITIQISKSMNLMILKVIKKLLLIIIEKNIENYNY